MKIVDDRPKRVQAYFADLKAGTTFLSESMPATESHLFAKVVTPGGGRLVAADLTVRPITFIAMSDDRACYPVKVEIHIVEDAAE